MGTKFGQSGCSKCKLSYGTHVLECKTLGLHTFPELLKAVVPGDLNLKNAILYDIGSQSGQALSTTPSNTHKQHIPSRLTYHTNDTTNCENGQSQE